MRTWRWLDLEWDDPRRNVAVEEAIFRAATSARGAGAGTGTGASPRATFRLWRSAPCVVIGCHQWVGLEVNLEACRRHGTPIVRRFTGGGAVYHDLGCLNFTLCVPKGSEGLKSAIPDLYDDFTLWLRRMLSSLGFEAKLARNRIVIGGRKVSGLAASVGRDAALVHGTLLVSTDVARLRELLAVPDSQIQGAGPGVAWAKTKRWVRSQPSPVATIEDLAGPGACPPIEKVAILARGFVESTYGVRLERADALESAESEWLDRVLTRKEEVDDGGERRG